MSSDNKKKQRIILKPKLIDNTIIEDVKKIEPVISVPNDVSQGIETFNGYDPFEDTLNENQNILSGVSESTSDNAPNDDFFEEEPDFKTKRVDTEKNIVEEITPNRKLERDIELEIDPNTTYFFVFGTASAGKSTMVSSLAYYLKSDTNNGGQIESTSSADKRNHANGDYILDQMIVDVKKGVFVKPTRILTDEELSSEINLMFIPSNVKKPNFPFCILEMAGEDLKKVKLRNFGKSGGILDDRINSYLTHPECSMIFICAVDTIDPSESEDFIDKFLDYTQKLGHRNNPVLITLNKWDLVSKKYLDGEDFLKKNTPILYKKLHDTNRYYSYLPFSIGELTTSNEFKYNSSDAQKLFEWMYEVSIGESLNQIKQKSILDKLFSPIVSMFKK